jgi:hypothetical protein
MADIIDTLIAMDDTALASKIGQDRALAKFKSDLADAAKLEPKLRTEAAERIERIVNPTPEPREIGWIVDDLQREQRRNEKKTAVAEVNDTSPASMAPLAGD